MDYAADVRAALAGARMPVMVTGGWRTAAAMARALAAGHCDLVGLGRPLCGDPDGPRNLLAGAPALPRYEDSVGGYLAARWLRRVPIKLVALLPMLAPQSWYYRSLVSLATTGAKAPVAPLGCVVRNQLHEYRKAKNLVGVQCRGSVHDGLPADAAAGRRAAARRVVVAGCLAAGLLAAAARATRTTAP